MDSWREAPHTIWEMDWVFWCICCELIPDCSVWIRASLCTLPKEGSLSECEALKKCVSQTSSAALQWGCSGVFGELLLSWSWLEILEGKWMHTSPVSYLKCWGFFSLVAFYLLEVDPWAFTERGSWLSIFNSHSAILGSHTFMVLCTSFFYRFDF